MDMGRLVSEMIKIGYGTILKASVTMEDEVETVTLIDNITGGNGKRCLVLDIPSMEILADCRDIEHFVSRFRIKEVVGQFDDMFDMKGCE